MNEILAQQAAARTAATDAILASSADVRVVVAGPGTGKTTLFTRALSAVGNSGLALTFIRNLANELREKLPETVRVNTFHGYCFWLLREAGDDTLVYPHLMDLVSDDLRRKRADGVRAQEIEWAFHDLDDSHGLITDALAQMADYHATSFTDVVYRTLKRLESNEDAIPTYPLVVVDEYQDFSKLETSFISLLGKRSHLLIAGDDDQSLYSFKRASPSHLRALTTKDGVSTFPLPYCSRCTEVVVGGVNDVIARARSSGYLTGRLEKPFDCFLPAKGADSQAHTKILDVRVATHEKSSNELGQYLVEQIRKISPIDIAESRTEGGEYPTVLVLGPEPFLDQSVKAIKESFPGARDLRSVRRKVELLDGYRLLATDINSKLGWRIVVNRRYDLEVDGRLTEALRSGGRALDALTETYRADNELHAGLVRALMAGEQLDAAEEAALTQRLGRSIEEIVGQLAPPEPDADDNAQIVDDGKVPTKADPTIVCTSLIGSKGLSAGHVFLVGFNERFFPAPGGLNDDEICKFVVALSRTRKECQLISVRSYAGTEWRVSPFLSWIREERVARVDIH